LIIEMHSMPAKTLVKVRLHISNHKGLTRRVLVGLTSLAQSISAGYTGRDADIVWGGSL
jgi:hypothetical protein